MDDFWLSFALSFKRELLHLAVKSLNVLVSTYFIEHKVKGRVLQVASVLQRNAKTQRQNKC